MRKLFLLLMLCSALFLFGNTAFSYPLLQLTFEDDAGYAGDTVTTDNLSNNLITLLNPDNGNAGTLGSSVTDKTFYLVVTWNDPGNHGTFGITDPTGPTTFTVDNNTGNFTWTQPYTSPSPILNHGELGSYGFEIPFQFDANDKATAFNVQNNPGGFQENVLGAFFFHPFAFDATGVDPFTPIHFDLYVPTGGNPEIIKAPFSKDASVVPEPASMLLLGIGLIGMASIGRLKLSKKS